MGDVKWEAGKIGEIFYRGLRAEGLNECCVYSTC
jgi:hypothetical protein